MSSTLHVPLLGEGRAIRVDEWATHTPVILYQARRADAFALQGETGPMQSILFGNAPVWHWTLLFRPQFWGFFVLPLPTAFAAYWQCKMLLLLSGTFFAFQLLTRSSWLAIFGSLWFYFSAFTQWAYSWPALLPEMLGLACWAAYLAARLCQPATLPRTILTGAAFVWVCVNFALCLYPPFQIPIVYAAAGLWLAWYILNPQPLPWLRLTIATLTVAATVGLLVYEIRDLIALVAQTVYPGRRIVTPGSIPVSLLASGFANYFFSEGHFPSAFGNICQAVSYYWLAIFTLPLMLALPRRHNTALAILIAVLALLTAWMLAPVPAWLGHILFLDRVLTERIVPAAGLLNIAIVLLALSALRTAKLPTWTIAAAASMAIATLTLFQTNAALGNFLTAPQVGISAALLALCLWSLWTARPRLLAAAILLPSLYAFALVNPIDQGLHYYLRTPTEEAIRRNNMRDAKWLVYGDSQVHAPFFTAMGLDVFNAFHYAPFLDRWRLFDPTQQQDSLYNGTGSANAYCLPPGQPPRMERDPKFAVLPPLIRAFYVSPSDPRLKQSGVHYFAHFGPPNPVCFPSEAFELVTPEPLNGMVLYKRKEGI
ncbi:hypothetical protein F183_A52870 [Bryobacterales bacterium F-183]|nr:hypothetical protein F183_A52870 [Bryobacterales bacterium F-183]